MIRLFCQVEALSKNPDLKSSFGNKPKMLKTLLYSIIEPICLGKAPTGQTKHALKDCPNILQLLYSVVRGSDKSYKYSLFLAHLKDKVIKYAYE